MNADVTIEFTTEEPLTQEQGAQLWLNFVRLKTGYGDGRRYTVTGYAQGLSVQSIIAVEIARIESIVGPQLVEFTEVSVKRNDDPRIAAMLELSAQAELAIND